MKEECSSELRGLLFSVPTGDKPKREMGFPTKESGRRETHDLNTGEKRWGRLCRRENSPFMETCRTADKYGCRGKVRWASLSLAERTESAAGLSFLSFILYPFPNSFLSLETLRPKERLKHTEQHFLRVIHWSISEFLSNKCMSWVSLQTTMNQKLCRWGREFCILNKLLSDSLTRQSLKGATTE